MLSHKIRMCKKLFVTKSHIDYLIPCGHDLHKALKNINSHKALTNQTAF